MKIGLIGASFSTGNLGVSALTESTIKCILHCWPDAEIVLMAGSREAGEHSLTINNRNVSVHKLPIRISRNIFRSDHFFVLFLYALLFKVFRWDRFKRFCMRRNPGLKYITHMDIVADISGGDSFSDIYGIYRFMFIVIFKWLVIFFDKPLILLPQTYGPFKSRIAKSIAQYILKRTQTIFSRDKAGVDYLRSILDDKDFTGKVKYVPDVAFILDSRKPEHLDIEPSVNIRKQGSLVVGLNVSGLLFSGGYTHGNMFDLKTEYRVLVIDVVKMLLKDENTVVFLIPHMFPQAVYKVESDPDACLEVYQTLRQVYPDKIFMVKGQYDQCEIKHIIGLCDFFIGSRMHSCIAAMSQAIPTVGLAYSKKFQGVFASVDAERFVVDMRRVESEHILTVIARALEEKELTAMHLRDIIPGLQKQILSLFEDI